MPRNRPVDYPQVHPPTAQPQLSLAPPRQPWAANEHDRFSWQITPASGLTPTAEQRLETGLASHNRDSKIPPLPVLPDHLSAERQSNIVSTEAVLPSQRSGRFQSQVQTSGQETQQHRQSQFRPDMPRNLQHIQHPGPTPSYEASQAAYSQHPISQTRMQEQPMYHYNASDAQLSSHALPMQDGSQSIATSETQDSTEEKPIHPEPAPEPEPQPQRLIPVHIGPDENPLSPTTPPTSFTWPTTTNIRTVAPQHHPHQPEMQFAQPTAYNQIQPQAARGGTWHHSLGSCAEPTTCLSSLFCPCFVYGRTAHRLSLKSSKKDPTNMLGYSAINSSCVAWTMLPGINIIMTAIQRTRVRKAYEMDASAGNVAADCMKSVCCCCCVIAQDEKEMRIREGVGLATKEADVKYQSPLGMSYAPPH